jgi:hypothetical protein
VDSGHDARNFSLVALQNRTASEYISARNFVVRCRAGHRRAAKVSVRQLFRKEVLSLVRQFQAP